MYTARVHLALAVVVVAVALASCGGGAGRPTTQSSRSSGVFGIVLFTGHGPRLVPASPLPLPGGFVREPWLDGNPFPDASVHVVAKTGANAGRVVATVKPNAQGLFRVTLPPGRYVLWPAVPRIWRWRTAVRVRSGAYARAEVHVMWQGF
jgi:hypothetical protein